MAMPKAKPKTELLTNGGSRVAQLSTSLKCYQVQTLKMTLKALSIQRARKVTRVISNKTPNLRPHSLSSLRHPHIGLKQRRFELLDRPPYLGCSRPLSQPLVDRNRVLVWAIHNHKVGSLANLSYKATFRDDLQAGRSPRWPSHWMLARNQVEIELHTYSRLVERSVKRSKNSLIWVHRLIL